MPDYNATEFGQTNRTHKGTEDYTEQPITGLLVKDYDEATGFYSGKLGFVVAEDAPMGSDRWVTIKKQ
jgi:hypothetical protein